MGLESVPLRLFPEPREERSRRTSRRHFEAPGCFLQAALAFYSAPRHFTRAHGTAQSSHQMRTESAHVAESGEMDTIINGAAGGGLSQISA